MPKSAYLLEEILWLEVEDAVGNSTVAGKPFWLRSYGWATRYWYCLPLAPQGYLERGGSGEPSLDGADEAERQAGRG